MTPPRGRQVGVALGMAAALAISVAGLGTALIRGAPAGFDARLSALATLLTILGLWIGVLVGRVAMARFFSAEDFDAAAGRGGSPSVIRTNAVLQNTVEQAMLAAFAGCAVTLLYEGAPLIVATQTGLFTIGRVLFWHGYARGAEARAFGFALTFYPSLLVLLGTLVGLFV